MKDKHEFDEYPGEKLDWTKGDIDPDSREALIAFQPLLRLHATAIGNFRSCRLPKCRRCKRCTGRHPLERLAIPFDHWSNFPPCVDTNEKQSALMSECRRYFAEEEAALLARGIDPETY